MTTEYNNIKLLHKNKAFIINTEAIEHNTKTLKNVGYNTTNILIQQKSTNLPKLGKGYRN